LFLLPLSSLSCDGGDTDQVELLAIARMLILLSLIGYVLGLYLPVRICIDHQRGAAVMLIAGMIFAAAGLSTVCFLTMIRKTEHFRQIQ